DRHRDRHPDGAAPAHGGPGHRGPQDTEPAPQRQAAGAGRDGDLHGDALRRLRRRMVAAEAPALESARDQGMAMGQDTLAALEMAEIAASSDPLPSWWPPRSWSTAPPR